MLRVGIAGLGFIGQVHLRNLLAHPEVAIRALADMDEGRRRGSIPGIQFDTSDLKSFADPMELCRYSELDAVVLCLPTDLHAEPTITALECGKHVFCEKPIDLVCAKGEAMVQAARRTGKTLMIGHVVRFWPEYCAAKSLLCSGRYGKAIAASFSRCRELPRWDVNSWFSDPKRSGGVGMDLHIHDADYCVSLWGRPDEIKVNTVEYQGVTNVHYSWWRYGDGPLVQFETAWEPAQKAPFHFSFKIVMEKATLYYDSQNQEGLRLATHETFEKVACESGDPYQVQDHYFIDRVLQGQPVDVCPPEESLQSLQCVLAEMEQMPPG